jgi:L-ascorbate metabolism protein UlaG (beta-lactamase superfamily)
MGPIQQMKSLKNIGKILKAVGRPHPHRRPSQALPQMQLTKDTLQQFSFGFSWLGHSSLVMNLGGLKLALDPVFHSIAPVQFVMKRFQVAPIDPEALEDLDLVILSHDHYDHLDQLVIQKLLKAKTFFFAPLKVKKHLVSFGVPESRIREFSWWDSAQVKDVEFTFTPAQHFSGRGLFDRDQTLWGSWVIKASGRKPIYFSGDSGYGAHFKEIGEKFGAFAWSFLENGQYNPAWKAVHMLPEESVQAHLDLKAEVFTPIHWGAYSLSPHAWYEPVERALALSKQNRVKLVTPMMGEFVSFGAEYQNTFWWRQAMELER